MHFRYIGSRSHSAYHELNLGERLRCSACPCQVMAQMRKKRQVGFSVMELLIVIAVGLVLMALAMPEIFNALKNNRLRQAGTDYANLLQTARMRAVQDDQYYAVLTTTAASSACVDLNQNGSCDGGTSSSSAEPEVNFHPTVQIQSPTSSSIPAASNLRSQYLPSTCGTNAGCVTIDPNTLPNGPMFGARGLPCYLNGGVCVYTSSAAGINGNSSSVPVAFETYLQSTQTSAWEAITVSPAGRIREWAYDSTTSAWKALN